MIYLPNMSLILSAAVIVFTHVHVHAHAQNRTPACSRTHAHDTRAHSRTHAHTHTHTHIQTYAPRHTDIIRYDTFISVCIRKVIIIIWRLPRIICVRNIYLFIF